MTFTQTSQQEINVGDTLEVIKQLAHLTIGTRCTVTMVDQDVLSFRVDGMGAGGMSTNEVLTYFKKVDRPIVYCDSCDDDDFDDDNDDDDDFDRDEDEDIDYDDDDDDDDEVEETDVDSLKERIEALELENESIRDCLIAVSSAISEYLAG